MNICTKFENFSTIKPVIIIIGLPGSGKTTLSKKIKNERNYDVIYDDFETDKAIQNIGKLNMIISDTMLLVDNNLDKFIKSCGKFGYELYAFENDKETCINNITKRWNNMSDLEKKKNSHMNVNISANDIIQFSRTYKIPKEAIVLPVYKNEGTYEMNESIHIQQSNKIKNVRDILNGIFVNLF